MSVKKLRKVLLNQRDFFILLVSTLVIYFIPVNLIVGSGIRIIVGIASFLYVPGKVLMKKLGFESDNVAEILGFSIIFGLLIQLLNTLALYNTLHLLPIDFFMSIFILTLLEVIIFKVLPLKPRIQKISSRSKYRSINVPLLCIFAIAILARLFYQSLNTQFITPDGALYCDAARNLVETGNFTSNIIIYNEAYPVYKILYKLGFIDHQFAWFGLAVFFEFGGPTYSVAKLAMVLFGSLLIFPVYGISHKLYSKKVGIIASTIVVFQPLELFFSSILFGTEMLASLFTLSAIYLLILYFHDTENLRYAFLGGLFIYASLATRSEIGHILLLSIIFLPFFTPSARRLKINGVLLNLLMASLLLLLFRLSTTWIVLQILLIPLLLLSLLVFAKGKRPILKGLCLIMVIPALLYFFGNLRAFTLFPEILSMAPSPQSQFSDLVSTQYHSLYSFATNMNSFWRLTKDFVTPLVFFLSLVSFLNFSHLRKNILVFLYPFLYSIVFSVYFLARVGLEFRFFVQLVPFLAILSAFAIQKVASALNTMINKGVKRLVSKLTVNICINTKRLALLRFNRKIIEFLFVLFLLVLIFFPSFWDGNIRWSDEMSQINPVEDLKMQPTVRFILENTSNEARLFNPNPTFYAWLTGRTTVSARNIDIFELLNIAREFNVDYVIIDPSTSDFLPDIYNFIERDWRKPLLGFSPVFYEQSTANSIPEVIIYDVRNARDISLKKEILTLINCDSAENWTARTHCYNDKLVRA